VYFGKVHGTAFDFIPRVLMRFFFVQPWRGSAIAVLGLSVSLSFACVVSGDSSVVAAQSAPDLPAAAADGSVVVAPPAPGVPAAPAGFVYISPGTFMMGSPSNEEGHYVDETQHSVTLTHGFFLQTKEVTQGEWQQAMGNNPSEFSSCGSDCPVETVSWLDAVGYANALSRAGGYSECYDSNGNVQGGGSIYVCTGYRLPTEAEWEYAARAGSSGARYGIPQQIAWYADNSELATHRVGELQANAWGLYDMLGNVSEWTHDWHDSYGGSVTDPSGPASGATRVRRGVSYNSVALVLRSALRRDSIPSNRDSMIGFRLARTAN